jgi:hypothetical protein
MRFDSSLKELLKAVSGKTDCDAFRTTTKANHTFALEYCARLLRFTIRHHGPVRDGHIQPELRRDAMAELLGFLQAETAVAARETTVAAREVGRAPVGAKPRRKASGRTTAKEPPRTASGRTKKSAAKKGGAKKAVAKKARTKARKSARKARR